MRVLGTIAVCVCIASPSAAAPTAGTLTGGRDGDILDYECVTTTDGRLSCSFVQVLLNSKSWQSDLAASLKTIPDLLNGQKEIADVCMGDLRNLFANLDAIASGETIKTFQAKDQDAMREALAGPQAAAIMGVSPALDNFCASPNHTTAKTLLTALSKMKDGVCKPMVNRYDQVFVQVDDLHWVAESSPSSQCGFVNTSRFEAKAETAFLWSYVAQRVTTNKTAAANGGIPCAEFNEEPTFYAWDARPFQVDCGSMG